MSLNVVSPDPPGSERSTSAICYECHSWLRDDGVCPVCAVPSEKALPTVPIQPIASVHACPECSAVPPFAARICASCGYRFDERVLIAKDRRVDTEQAYRCGRCKSPLVEGARYCSTCGREFTEAAFGTYDPRSPGGYALEQHRRSMLVNTFIQGSGFVVLAASIIFVVFLCMHG